MQSLLNVKVLFVGPMSPPVTGQALAFKEAYNHIKCQKSIIWQNTEGKSVVVKVMVIIFIFFQSIVKILAKRPNIIYLSCSRSFKGSIKDMPTILLGILLNIPIICHIQGSDFTLFMNNTPAIFRKLYTRIYSQLSLFVVLLPGMIKEVTDVLGSKVNIEVIPNFYDSILDEYKEQSNRLTSDGITNITFLSNLIYSKGIIHLLQAFDELSYSNPHIKLFIAGNCLSDEFRSKKEVLSEMENMLSKNQRITYLGPVHGQKKAELLYKTDILALPTFYKPEALPLALLEGMRAGAVILTTNHNHLASLINNDNGILVKPNSVDDIKSGLASLLSLSNKEFNTIREHNVQQAKLHYSLHKYIARLEEVFIKTIPVRTTERQLSNKIGI